MNPALAREIYGNTPWMIDAFTCSSMMRLLQDFRSGVKFDLGGDSKNNSIFLYDTKSATRIVTDNYQLRNADPDSQLVYVINLNGVITKNGGMSTNGTKQLSAQMLAFDKDERISGGIILGDSGGGSSAAIELMTYAHSVRTKPVVSLVERGGMSASAAYGIMSGADYFMSESTEAIVGSIGTMISFSSIPHGTVDFMGEKHVTLYATKSVKKNLAFEEAINKDNFELLVNEMLDPVNENFISLIKKNRANVLDSQLDGSVYKAGDVIGTLVDGIGTFEDAVSKVLELSSIKNSVPRGTQNNSKPNNKLKSKCMDVNQLKSDHPEVYNSVYNAGVTAEADRTGAWLAHAKTDIDSVVAGVKSGKEITATATQELLIKSFSATTTDQLKSSSAPAVTTKESESVETTEEQTELSQFESAVKGQLQK